MSIAFKDLIERRAFGVARVLGGAEHALTPSWFARGLDGGDPDGLGSLDDLFAAEDALAGKSLDRLFEREGGGLSLHVRAGESGGESGSRHTDFVASTADVDRMGDIIDQKTWRLGAWRSNPVILHEHGGGWLTGPSLHAGGVVGRGVGKVNRDADRLEIRVHWDEADVNPLGQLMAHQHANGFRRAMSVGFMPGKAINRASDALDDDDPRKAPEGTPEWKAGMIFSHNELLESSTVGVPANAAAVQLSQHVRSIEGTDEQARAFIEESVSSNFAENLIAALKNDEIKRQIVALVWASPEPVATNSIESMFNRNA